MWAITNILIMANKAEELLKQCLEIEGLLSLISTREDTTPDVVYAMLKEKVSALDASVSTLEKSEGLYGGTSECPDQTEYDEAIASSAELEESEDAFEEPESSDSSDIASDEPADENKDIEVELVYTDDIPEETNESDLLVDSPSDFIPLEDVSESFEEDKEFVDEAEINAEKNFMKNPEPSETEPVDAEDDEEPESTPVLSDKFAEFTLNDKFRFRRELFGNSDIDMNEALDVVNAMTSREEVEDYFYNDMCWDPNNDDVKDFIRIVTAKFAN